MALPPFFEVKIPPHPGLIIQRDCYSCGATAVEMALSHLKMPQEIEYIKELFLTNPKTGTTHEGMIAGLEALKIPYVRSFQIEKPFEWLDDQLEKNHLFLMRTLTYGCKHWILCYGKLKDKYQIADPAGGYIQLTQEEVQGRWEPREWDGFAIQIPCGETVNIHRIQNNDELLEAFIAGFLSFSEFRLGMTLKAFANTVTGGVDGHFEDSWVAVHNGEVVGGYFIGHRQVGNMFPTKEESEAYKAKKGVEGVALFVLPAYRGYDVGRVLRDIPKYMDADYIWGSHFDVLNNIKNWVKYGRRVLSGGIQGSGGGHTTLMDLR